MVKNHHPDCSITIQIDFDTSATATAPARQEELKLVKQGLRGCLRFLLENFLLKEADPTGNPELGLAGAKVS